MNPSRLNSILDWSMPVGKLFGIPIRLHITILFFLWPVLSARQMAIPLTLEYVVGIVLSILLHELGHALAAKQFKLTGLSIMLHGFGGFAVSSGHRTPRQDLIISLMGPAVTFALGFLLKFVGNQPFLDSHQDQAIIIYSLGQLNILLGLLNLIPSLPFDGGQSLRAILNHRMTYFSAMRIVAHLGLVICPILFVVFFAMQNTFASIFPLMGFITSLTTVLQSGGVKFGDLFRESKERKVAAEMKKREEGKTIDFLDKVRERERLRAEEERLRKMFEDK